MLVTGHGMKHPPQPFLKVTVRSLNEIEVANQLVTQRLDFHSDGFVGNAVGRNFG